MTAIGISTPALSPLARRTGAASERTVRLRLTTRGRRVLAVLAALPAVIALSLAAISGGAALASRDDGAPAGAFTTISVAAGDSLWSIAEEVAPGHDPRDVVDAIVRLNALGDVTVVAGQSLAIPEEYASR
jgi:Tfp pilus assembly protein FimV